MTARRPNSVLRPGDWITFDDGDHQVVSLAGTSVRLRLRPGVCRRIWNAADSWSRSFF